MTRLLQFVPFTSQIDSSFWFEFAKQKIDILQLNDDPLLITGITNSPPALFLDFSSLRNRNSTDTASTLAKIQARVTLINTNTMISFKNFDKHKAFNSVADEIYDSIVNGDALKDPSLLLRFLLLTFADLKKFKFYSLMACPALRLNEIEAVVGDGNEVLISLEKDEIWGKQFPIIEESIQKQEISPVAFVVIRLKKSGNVIVRHLFEFREMFEKYPNDDVFVAFNDVSTRNYPSWFLRNLLFLVAFHFKVKQVNVLCFRGAKSFTLCALLPDLKLQIDENEAKQCVSDQKTTEVQKEEKKKGIPAVGWEVDLIHPTKTKTKIANLEAQMDPVLLSTTASELNLKLMKWRMFKEIDLPLIQAQKCLLIGAGTLGCNVARTLLGWGIRNVTFIDQARVAFSNPARQSLFTFTDCVSGEFKATAAAEMMKKISPGLNAVGKVLSVPMPGHSVDIKNKEAFLSVKEAWRSLDALIDDHDVVFLLGDSKEVRWLPTVIAQAKNKLVLNAGLGFDSYVVMRHGQRGAENTNRLSCYFCSDINAPRDSISDRTLDQACTVTRPGISMMASALAVELFISVLHHPKRGLCPAENAEAMNTSLGSVPQQIRGFLSQWKTITVSGDCYSKCTACSDPIVNAYKKDGFDFVIAAMNTPEILEELTGIVKEKNAAAEWEFSVEDDF